MSKFAVGDQDLPKVVTGQQRQTDDREYFESLGLDPASAGMLVDAEVSREAAGPDPAPAIPFVRAALYQGLDDIGLRLLEANGNPDLAWRQWAEEEEAREAEADLEDDEDLAHEV